MTKTTSSIHPLNTTLSSTVQHQFNGAAIVDEFGQETPITESMVQHACNALNNSWHSPSQSLDEKNLVTVHI